MTRPACRHFSERPDGVALCQEGPFAGRPLPIARQQCAPCGDYTPQEVETVTETNHRDLTKPGIYEGVPFADYLAIPAVSNSGVLSTMRTSPLHCRHAQTHPRPDSSSMALGRAAHCAILEPGRWPSVPTAPDVDRRTKAGKEAWTAFVESSEGAETVTPAERATADAIAAAVRANPHAAADLDGARTELTLIWRDRLPGCYDLICKARVDYVPTRRNALGDLKTARYVDARRFASQAASLGYDIAAAHYLRGWHVLTGERRSWTWLAVEPTAPHDVAIWHADPAVIEDAGDERERLLTQYAYALETGIWRGQCPEPATLPWPRWALADDDEWSAEAKEV